MGQGSTVSPIDTIRPSGVTAPERDDVVEVEIKTLVVPLAQLRRKIAEAAAIGEPVTVAIDADGMPVATADGVLGQVPPGYRRRIRRAGLSRGNVQSLEFDPLSCTVLLRPGMT